MRPLGILLLALALAPRAALASGATSANFLQMDLGARSIGMGGAFVAVADDHNAFYHNLAGLAKLDKKQASLSYLRAPMDVAYHDASYAHPLGQDWTAGVDFVYMNVGPISKTDANGNFAGTYMGSGLAAEASAAKDLGRGLRFGLGGKAVRESLDTAADMVPAFDMGLLYDHSRFRFGAAVRDLGTGIKLSNDTLPLPMTASYGASYRVTEWGIVDSLTFAAEAKHVRSEKMQGAVGAELRLTGSGTCDSLALRIGYKIRGESQADGSDITGSFGVRILENYDVDLAFLPYENMGILAVVSLTVRFGETRGH